MEADEEEGVVHEEEGLDLLMISLLTLCKDTL
jgi:hypothetical protein